MLIRGTMVTTHVGRDPVAVEDLTIGMSITDPLSGSPGRIERHDTRRVALDGPAGISGIAAPVIIPRGALGNGRPESPLVVSPQQEIGFVQRSSNAGRGLFAQARAHRLRDFGIATEDFDEGSAEYHSLVVSNVRYLFAHGVLISADRRVVADEAPKRVAV